VTPPLHTPPWIATVATGAPEAMAVDLYAGKTALLGRLTGIVDRLAAAGVSPDTVTLAALPVAAAAGALLLLSPTAPGVLLAVPILAALRLLLNLLDGALARRTGRMHPRGELLNEFGDRVADVAFLAPVATLPGASAEIVLLGVLGAVLASYIGITAKAAGGDRIYRGVLSKPGRMVLLSACSLGYLVIGPAAWTAFGPILLVGTALTIVERLAIAARRLP
jgi:CDP-diacylglycerol---glycerol-3-phosphate 3-phosphatidyltransferase